MISVAGSDVPQVIKDQAHYLCTGTDDQVQINQAIAAAGVTAVFLIGTFNVSAPVEVNKAGFTLKGIGEGSFIEAANTFPDGGRGIVEVGQTTSYRPNVRVQGLKIGGRKTSQGSKTIHGLKFGSYRGRIVDVDVANCNGDGILLACPPNASNDKPNKNTDAMILHCQSSYNRDVGVRFNSGGEAEDMHIVQCIFMHNGKQGNTKVQDGSHAVWLSSASQQFVDCHCYGNTGAGIYFNNPGARTKILGCKIEMNEGGAIVAPNGMTEVIIDGCGFRGGKGVQIDLRTNNGSNLTITGCVMTGELPTGDASAEKAIDFGNGVNNAVVVGNRIGGNYTTDPKIVQGNANNLFANNTGWP